MLLYCCRSGGKVAAHIYPVVSGKVQTGLAECRLQARGHPLVLRGHLLCTCGTSLIQMSSACAVQLCSMWSSTPAAHPQCCRMHSTGW